MIRNTSLGAVLLLAVPAFASGSPGREATVAVTSVLARTALETKVERLKALELERAAPLGEPDDHPLWP